MPQKIVHELNAYIQDRSNKKNLVPNAPRGNSYWTLCVLQRIPRRAWNEKSAYLNGLALTFNLEIYNNENTSSNVLYIIQKVLP